MCKTLEEVNDKLKQIKILEEKMKVLEQEIEILQKSQCGGCKMRCEHLKSQYEDLLRTGD